jgi:hypothetical protein
MQEQDAIGLRCWPNNSPSVSYRRTHDAQSLEWALIELSKLARVFFVFMRPGTLFICKRRGGPRIGAPHQIPFGNAISADSAQTVVSGCPDRAMLPKTPFSRPIWCSSYPRLAEMATH